MPVNKSAMVRYRIIDGCLRNSMHRCPSIDYLQSKINDAGYDVSVSMLRKDLQAMKEEFHAPIEHDRKRGGYYYTDQHFSIQGVPLTEDEIAALDYSTALLQQIKGSKMFQQFESAINKLIEGYRISKITGEETTRFLQIEEPLRQTDSQWLEPILQAVVNTTVLRIAYHPFGREEKEHLISPYLLKEYHNRWYLVGHSERADNILVMALDRIQRIEKTDALYVYPASFKPEDFFRYSFGITQIHGEEPERVVLSFTPHQAQYILSQPLHHSQKLIKENQKEIQVEYLVYLSHELTMSILSYGANVKVIAPEKLKDRIADAIKEMSKLYS
jgi:predicted DNA-binding transcriptional regulator YafY